MLQNAKDKGLIFLVVSIHRIIGVLCYVSIFSKSPQLLPLHHKSTVCVEGKLPSSGHNSLWTPKLPFLRLINDNSEDFIDPVIKNEFSNLQNMGANPVPTEVNWSFVIDFNQDQI